MVLAEHSAKALAPLNGVMEQGGGYGLQESVFAPDDYARYGSAR